jgi:hypothetical protein
MRLNVEGANLPNENIRFYNNLWCDPTGTMGAENPSRPNDFSDTPIGETASFELFNNLYWNGNDPIPSDVSELINYTEDTGRVVEDPALPAQTDVTLPWWNAIAGQFNDGSSTIREAFESLVNQYGIPLEGSAAIDSAAPIHSATEDILGNPRPSGNLPDIGAVEARQEGEGPSAVSRWRVY